jgi:hypothetical protein
MAENKTKQTGASVKKFIAAIANEQKRTDALVVLDLMQRATKAEPKMWGPSIIGFGFVHYKYESGHEGDMCLMGFSPRKASHSIYLPGGPAAYPKELKQLGKHKASKACLYINKLADVDLAVLKKMIEKGAKPET